MLFVTWIFIISVFLYTTGFSYKLWKQNEKLGSVAVMILAVSVVIIPFFSVF
ncbi:hypothetical protein [Fictibacillus phosphorivorans]|uniref:hypothetical protein n=1 Tax=Fictibacillus phosphorivorans TaxID=1221500 RepID=UPI000AB49964|nr:hypothetical protein [Fictibacillus phosphorivorans]